MPVTIILLQASISSVLALGYHLLGSVQNAWFMFALVQTNMSLLLYILMLIAVVRLRRRLPRAERPYRIPGGRLGLGAVCGAGLIVCVFGLVLSLFPTDDADGLPLWVYEVTLIAGTAAFVAVPLLLSPFRKPSWKVESAPLPEAAAASHAAAAPDPGPIAEPARGGAF
jgi:amino acid transporter